MRLHAYTKGTLLPRIFSSVGGPLWKIPSRGTSAVRRASRHIEDAAQDRPNQGLYWVRSDGTGGAQRLTSGDEVPYSFSHDGRRLAFWAPGVSHSADLFTAVIQGGPDKPSLGSPELFLGTAANEAMPAFSPDGRWIA